MTTNTSNNTSVNETFAKHLNYMKQRVQVLNEGMNDNEQAALANLKRLASMGSEDLADALRDFQAIYGYRPNVETKTGTSHGLAGRTLYFYNVPMGKEKEAIDAGLKKTKTNKWYSLAPSQFAEKLFGKGRSWKVK